MAQSYFDGTYTAPLETNAPLVTYPFGRYPVPDVYARMIKRYFTELPASFVPLIAQRTNYTNYLLQSENFTVTWSATAVTVATGATANPMDGTITGNSMLETSASSTHGVSQAFTFTATPTVFEVFVQANGRNWVYLNCYDGTTNHSAFFNLATGAASTGSNCTSSIYAGGPGATFGWYRCMIEFTPAAATGTVNIQCSSDGSTLSYGGNASDGLYLWGAQLELASSPGPYAMTTMASNTISAPVTDVGNKSPGDIFAYLVDETDLAISEMAIAKYVRTYSRIPSEKNVPSSMIVTKPDIPKTGIPVSPYVSNAFYQYVAGLCYYLTTATPQVMTFQRNINVPVWELYRCVTSTADSGPLSGANNVSGGTYQLVFGNSGTYITASLNYNATAGQVASALNALTLMQALGTCTVTGSYTAGFVVQLPTISTATVNIGSLTGSPSPTVYVGPVAYGYAQQVLIGSNVTGGTYTITILGQTTAAISYSSGIAGISSALNNLSNVTAAGGCTVVGTGFIGGIISFLMSFLPSPGTLGYISGITSSLVPTGATIVVTQSYAVYCTQNITLYGAYGRVVTVPNHGFYSNDVLVIGTATYANAIFPSAAFFDIAAFTILNSNQISLTVQGGAVWQSQPYICCLGARRIIGYQPAPINTRCQVITDYYLPGVTPGVATAAAIPIPASQSDPASFLGALVQGTTINYEVGDAQAWQGPIIQVSKKVIQVTDLNLTTSATFP